MARFPLPPAPTPAPTLEPAVPVIVLTPQPRDLATATVPDYSYLGCYTDYSDQNRLLQGASSRGDGLSPGSCCSWCLEQDAAYIYCGMQVGNQCWCDSSLAQDHTQIDGNNCDNTCDGDAANQCGGYYAMAMYISKMPPTALAVPGYSNLGCFRDDEIDRILQGTNTEFGNYDAQTCCEWCAAKSASNVYCGVEFGSQCSCGSTIDRSEPMVSAECNMPCSGNTEYQCGSAWRMNVYHLTDVPATKTTEPTEIQPGRTGRQPGATETQPGTTTPNPSPTNAPKHGYSTSDRIAMGCGIGFGLPTVIIGIAACVRRR